VTFTLRAGVYSKSVEVSYVPPRMGGDGPGVLALVSLAPGRTILCAGSQSRQEGAVLPPHRHDRAPLLGDLCPVEPPRGSNLRIRFVNGYEMRIHRRTTSPRASSWSRLAPSARDW
jgi:hypothetical protein